jgi:release factor glutamine methyltransferase
MVESSHSSTRFAWLMWRSGWVTDRSLITSRGATVNMLIAVLQQRLGEATSRTACDILAALLDMPRFWPISHGDDTVDASVCHAALTAVERLRRGAPFAYAVGRAAFRHLTLSVDERVLIPRPETEVLVDEVLRLAGTATGIAIDVGTGSGAIALSLASEGKFSSVIATDISLDALAVARANAAASMGALRAPVEFRHGSLLAPVREVRAAAVISNPPYIAYHESAELPASVRDWEPSIALLCGDSGLALTAQLVREAAEVLEAGGILALEVDTRRAALVAELVAVDGRYHDVAVRYDLTGRERFVIAGRK